MARIEPDSLKADAPEVVDEVAPAAAPAAAAEVVSAAEDEVDDALQK